MILSRSITDDDFFKQIKAKKLTQEGKNPQGFFALLHIVSVPFQKTRPTTRNIYKLKLQSTLRVEKKTKLKITHSSLVILIKENSLLYTHYI